MDQGMNAMMRASSLIGAVCAAVLQALPTLAAEGHSSGGMPQLNPANFTPQLFWLGVTFIALYLLMSKLALPRVESVLDARAERIANDLDRAAALKAEAEAAMQAYEKAQVESRAKAADLVRQAETEVAKATAARQAQLGRELGERLKSAEQRIAAAKAAAMGNLAQVSSDVARAAVERLIGESVSPADVERVTAALARERGGA
jgi:F-type H+-transporting ATPase subunit b